MNRSICIACLILAGFCSLVSAEEPAQAAEKKPCNVGYRRTNLTFKTPGGEDRKRTLDLWYPTAEKEGPLDYLGQKGVGVKNASVAPGKHPVLLFSHGYLGMSDQSIFLTEACARHGYVVASMNHGDAIVSVFRQKQDPPKFLQFATWTDEKYRDRRDDIEALLDSLTTWNGTDDSPFAGSLDMQHIGGMGHSLGGYTMLGLAGGWKSWREPRIKTAVLFSPFAQPYDVNGQLDEVTIPVMIQGGTLDLGITPFLPSVYRKLPGPKSYLVLKKESHFGWTNLVSLGKTTTEAVSDGNPELIVKYTVAFFDQYLLGQDEAKILEGKDPELEIFRTEKPAAK
jgi:predicted dienelactone hydrolase